MTIDEGLGFEENRNQCGEKMLFKKMWGEDGRKKSAHVSVIFFLSFLGFDEDIFGS